MVSGKSRKSYRLDSGKSRKAQDSAQSRRKDSGQSRRRRNSDESEDNQSPVSRAPSSRSKVSSAERFNRRMSYVPPRVRKNSIKKGAESAVSRRTVKNFDEKKYQSNSLLTPVDW